MNKKMRYLLHTMQAFSFFPDKKVVAQGGMLNII